MPRGLLTSHQQAVQHAAGLAGMTSSCSLDLTAPSIYVARPGTQMLNPSYLEPAQLVELRAKWAKPPGDWSAAKLARYAAWLESTCLGPLFTCPLQTSARQVSIKVF